jgi:purine-binding chemotaxis protein CheW
MTVANDNAVAAKAHGATADAVTEFVTVFIGEQLFGLPINRVQDVFIPDRLTEVPLAPREIAGVLNLRGRIITAIDMRCRLDLPPAATGRQAPMAVGTEFKGENFGLIIDQVGEVMTLSNASREPNPVNLDARWAKVSAGVHRLEGQLMVVLDIDRILELANDGLAA